MKTILILTACYDEPHRTMGSAPKLARQLAKHARVVVFSGGSSDRVERRSENLTVHFAKEWLIPDPVNNAIVPGMLRKLRAILDMFEPDAVINLKYMFYPNLAGIYLHYKGYRVITVTDAFPGYSWFSASKIVSAIIWLYTRTLGKLVLSKSDKVVLFHQGIEADAKKLGLNYTIIPNGVEPELLEAAPKKTLKGNTNVLYVGRLESVKGYETILKAAQKFTHDPDIHFYHVGDLKGKDHIIDAYASPQIHFEGRKSLKEVYSYMKGADMIVLASRSEGLPNVLMEGMACECVPISTAVGAVPWLLEEGKLGRMFPFGDENALAKCVMDLKRKPKLQATLRKKCRKKILEEYNWSALSKQYMDVLFPQGW